MVIKSGFRLLNIQNSSFVVLVRHFFRRLFINDFISFEEAMQQKIIALLAILAIFSGNLANALLTKYMFVPDRGTSWVEKCYFLFLVMVITGFITVVEWDVLFPDRKDFLNLKPLPVRQAAVFTSKLTSLCLFVGLFTLGTISVSVFVFLVYLPGWHSSSLLYGFLYVLAHIISCVSAALFIFFSIASLIGLLMILLGNRVFQALSPYIRGLMLTAFVIMMMIFFMQSISIPDILASLPALKRSNSPSIYLFPPMWFTGLYESILGTSDPVFKTLSEHGLLSLAVLLPLSLALIFLRYTAATRKMLESKKLRKARHRVSVFESIFYLLFLRNLIERAIYYFFGRTLKKSIQHKMRLISYLAIALGIALVLMASASVKLQVQSVPGRTFLSLPFILSFFLLVGLRSSTEMPSSPRSNWIFELTEDQNCKRYFLGLKKGVIFLALLPFSFFTLVFYGLLWDWRHALFYSLYCLLITCLLMEIVFFNYRKIPFACNTLPGKSRMHVFWLVYLLSFLAYVFFPVLLALELMKRDENYFFFFAVMLVILTAIRILRNFIYKKAVIIYEEEPEPVMITMDLP